MIRRATPADAEALSTLARTCFTQTFGHLYAPVDLETFLDEAYAPDVLRAELEDPNRATWFLFEDATDEGFSQPAPSPADHPRAPESGDEAPASSHPATGKSSASTSCRATRGRGAAPSSSRRRSNGSSATARAPCGSACGAKTTGRSASTRGTDSRSLATTRSWWATTPTTS